MASPAIFKGRLTKFLTNGGILIPARPQTTDASAIPTPGELAYDTENENFVVYQNGDWEVVAVFDDLIASNIVNTPYGDIVAVNVQSALNELDDEKVARAGDSLTGNLTFATNTGIESTDELSTLNIGTNVNAHVVNIGTGDHTSTVNIGTGTGPTTINIGGTDDKVAIAGTLTYVNVTDLQVNDKNIIVNVGGAAASGNSAGLHVEEDGVLTGYNHVANNRQSWELIAPANPGAIHLTPSVDAFTAEIKSTVTANRTLTLPDTTDTLATNTQIVDVNTRIDDLTTDDVPELTNNPANLYFTDIRAKTAAVVNTVAGNQTDQAPSVSSIVTYVNAEINALTTDDIEEGSSHKYFTTDRAQDAVGPAIELGTNVAGNPISASYSDVDDKIAITISDASTTVRGAAVFSPDDFAVGGSGEIIVKAAGIGNAQLENSSITANGNEIALGDDVFVGIETINASTSITAGTNRRIMVDTSGGAVEITLPAGSLNAYIELKDAVGSWDVNNLTITPAAGEKINGLAVDESLIGDVRQGWISLAWDVANSRWNISTTAAISLPDIVASASEPGIVSIENQSFAGIKTFTDGIILEPNTTPVVNPTSGLQVYAKADNKLYTLTSGGLEQAVGSGGSIILVTQVAHGFTAADVGRPLYLNGSTYEFAKADTEATAEVAGLISRVIDLQSFEICLGGEIQWYDYEGWNTIQTNGVYTINSNLISVLNASMANSAFHIEKIVLVTTDYQAPATDLAGNVTNLNFTSSYVKLINDPSLYPAVIASGNANTESGTNFFEFGNKLYSPSSGAFEYTVLFDASVTLTLTQSSIQVQSGPETVSTFYIDYIASDLTSSSFLTSGEVYYLSPYVPGKITATPPSVVGQIAKPVGIARTTTEFDFFNMRGNAVGGSNVYTQIGLANSATTTIQNASAYDSVELAGWVYINATTDLRFHFKAQVTKKGDGTDYLVSFQTSGDTPPSGFDIDVTSGGLVQVVMPSVAGFTSAIAQFSLNGPAVGASLPLQIESNLINYSQSPSYRNRIINGDMRIDQRNAGASVSVTTVGPYTVDRWRILASLNSKFSAQQNADTTTPPLGFSNYIRINTDSAVTVVDTDYFLLQQGIEGYNIVDLQWGTANAKMVTLSFWVLCNQIGTFSGCLKNYDNTRGYPFTFEITQTNTWKLVTLQIPGDTSGTWETGNLAGIRVTFDVGSGNDYRFSSNSWQTGNVIGATGSARLISTLNAKMYITGVQLEAGSVATPFEHRPIGLELQLCQRYYEKSYAYDVAPGASTYYPGRQTAIGPTPAGEPLCGFSFSVVKRGKPIIKIYNPGTGTENQVRRYNGSVAVPISISEVNADYNTNVRGVSYIAPASGSYSVGYNHDWHWTADAEL